MQNCDNLEKSGGVQLVFPQPRPVFCQGSQVFAGERWHTVDSEEAVPLDYQISTAQQDCSKVAASVSLQAFTAHKPIIFYLPITVILFFIHLSIKTLFHFILRIVWLLCSPTTGLHHQAASWKESRPPFSFWHKTTLRRWPHWQMLDVARSHSSRTGWWDHNLSQSENGQEATTNSK